MSIVIITITIIIVIASSVAAAAGCAFEGASRQSDCVQTSAKKIKGNTCVYVYVYIYIYIYIL